MIKLAYSAVRAQPSTAPFNWKDAPLDRDASLVLRVSGNSYELSFLSRPGFALTAHSLRVSSRRHTGSRDLTIYRSSTLRANKSDHHAPTKDYDSSSQVPGGESINPSKQNPMFSRRRSIRKSLRKLISRCSREPLPMYSPPAAAWGGYAAKEYTYLGPAELPTQREPCELPATDNSVLHQRLYRHEDMALYTSPADAVSWQRHHTLDWAISNPPKVARGPSAFQGSSCALTPINTTVETARTSPVRVSAEYVTPNLNRSHDCQTTDVAGTGLSSRPPIPSPYTCHFTASTSISPTGSALSSDGCRRTIELATLQHVKEPLHDFSGLSDSDCVVATPCLQTKLHIPQQPLTRTVTSQAIRKPPGGSRSLQAHNNNHHLLMDSGIIIMILYMGFSGPLKGDFLLQSNTSSVYCRMRH